jgi:hypothetical protein
MGFSFIADHRHSPAFGNYRYAMVNHLSNIKYVYIFGSIALFIILLACVNFMNLSTARASNRARK